VSQQASQYLKGLTQARKKNMERMAERIPESNDQALQHFLSCSPWDERPVVDQVAQDANTILKNHPDTGLYIDETGFVKKGTKSVGVHRQWIGQLGKVDNSQCGVFAALGCKNRVTPVDFRLYLPKVWTDDKERCLAAGIPEEKIVFKRKHNLALEMVAHARSLGTNFNWVGCDGLYGEDPDFLRSLDDMGEVFLADVHKDQRIYPIDPDPVVPPPQSKRGRKPSLLKAQTAAIRVDKWVAEQAEGDWQRLSLRKTTKGKLIVDVLHKQVWLWDGKENKPHLWHLIVRRELKSPEKLKYSLSNATLDTSTDRLAYMQAQRFWIERSFQDAKSQCGMSDYQARSWRSWHHHMAMILLVMLFFLEERLLHKEDCPLLSCGDIIVLLCHYLPRRDISEEEVFRQMQIRHEKRQASIDWAYKKQHAEDLLQAAG
jgi:SRSO17 transposase